jgi:hypothetical protein
MAAICAHRTAGVDVKLPFEIVALNASTGRIARLVLSFFCLIRQDRAPRAGVRHRPVVGGDGS